ncbi:MAG TPA: right-handed parallel beta-helix repeat-containing protein [Bryobacteraceae bacterium]|nr:right-handed parallel beta-helix repeat-containing protein [Bryobacteraceae bacterium]
MKTSFLCLWLALSWPALALDVRTFGAVGNGSQDDTQAIQNAINACPDDGTLDFGAGTYAVTGLYARSRCTYSGGGNSTLILAAGNAFILNISERSGIRITGLKFNGNQLGGAIIAQGFAPADNIHIDHCEFRNIVRSATYPANLAIVSTWGLTNSTIESNQFVSIAGGIWITTVQNVGILNNSFTDVTEGSAIYIAPNAVSFPSGDGLRIAGNSGSNLVGTAIEIFQPDPPNGSVLNAPVIEDNSFSNWIGSGVFGLSITHGNGAIIRNNRLNNSTGVSQFAAIELIAPNARVEGNVINGGFSNGVAVQGAPAPSITGNTITGMGDNGIILACDLAHGRCASRKALISNNLITNAHHAGVKLDNDWSDSVVSRNTILRTAGFWGDDGQVLFSGIHQSPAPGTGVIDGNWIIQNSPTWPQGFWFAGIRINSSMPGSSVTNNMIGSSAVSAFGSGIIDNTGAAFLGWNIQGNSYLNVFPSLN